MSETSSCSSSSALEPPPGFLSIEQLKNLPTSHLKAGTPFVNVIGFVTDFQMPMMTRGTDWKCTFEIKDHSDQGASYGLKVTIFWPERWMPKISNLPGDAVLIRKAKPQMFNGRVCLLANVITEFHVLSASNMSQAHFDVTNAPWKPSQVQKPSWTRPTPIETNHVILASRSLSQIELPTAEEFQERTIQSTNIKDKFGLLKDVVPDCFYDFIGEVIRIYDGSDGCVTVYFSDYTANKSLYNYEWRCDGVQAVGREGDEYGYTSKSKKQDDWPGPFGKLTIQLTLYDPHAEFVREKVEVGQWLLLKNVRIKYGKDGGRLEGVIHTDKKMMVERMRQSDEPGDNDARWKQAVGRKREWWLKFEKQKQEVLEEEAAAREGRKRQNDEPPMKTSKRKRKEKRAAAIKKVATTEAKIVEKLDLNPNIRCSHPDHPVFTLEQILKQQYMLDPHGGQDIPLPFVNANYKANVRIIGYFPHNIKDFAVGRRATEYDMLSDYSGGEETDLEEGARLFKAGKGFGQKKWEWRFALEVEDASSKGRKERMWLHVDNHAAQALLVMDAASLRTNPELLNEMKERLCILWGDLEEQKSAALAKPTPTPPMATFQPTSSPFVEAGEQPDINSDDENDMSYQKPLIKSGAGPLEERDTNAGATKSIDPYQLTVRNKAFTCCIQQYGVRVDEEDLAKADSGAGKRWERKFRLFGVTI